ncbi:MAG TPA: hypothetical protein ENI61_03925 [Ignavibacteria bacterium]|nr:hypothetical protein [Ignavibacteria bacterium]
MTTFKRNIIKEKQYNKINLNYWITEILGWTSFILFFMTIWINGYRWKLFLSSLFLFILAILNYAGNKNGT